MTARKAASGRRTPKRSGAPGDALKRAPTPRRYNRADEKKAAASRRSPESRQLTANSSEKNIRGGHEPPLSFFLPRRFNEPVNRGEPKRPQLPKHEPVNEQGVVLLFGMLAKELGYMVEAMQRGFPDCEAKRRIGPERWQRVHIEFEFESKNFRDHGHPASGCDVIVCWRHNWDDCPEDIEVVELSSVVKSLADTED